MSLERSIEFAGHLDVPTGTSERRIRFRYGDPRMSSDKETRNVQRQKPEQNRIYPPQYHRIGAVATAAYNKAKESEAESGDRERKKRAKEKADG